MDTELHNNNQFGEEQSLSQSLAALINEQNPSSEQTMNTEALAAENMVEKDFTTPPLISVDNSPVRESANEQIRED